MTRIFLLAALLINVSGCVNGFKKYYTPVVEVPVTEIDPKLDPLIDSGRDPQADVLSMLEDGYRLLGYSQFTASADEVYSYHLKSHAKAVGAERVLYYQRHLGTSSSAMPLTLPTSTTTTGSYYGSVGGTNFNAYGSQTTYGTKTTYIPITTVTNSYGAFFFKKSPGTLFGAIVDDLSADDRAALERNAGVKVVAVVKGSPAFKANIFRGDVITAVNKKEIMGADDYYSHLPEISGKSAKVTVLRKGKKVIVSAVLNEDPYKTPDRTPSSITELKAGTPYKAKK